MGNGREMLGRSVTLVDTPSAGELVTLSAIHSAQCNLPDDIMRCVTRNVIGVSCCVWYFAGLRPSRFASSGIICPTWKSLLRLFFLSSSLFIHSCDHQWKKCNNLFPCRNKWNIFLISTNILIQSFTWLLTCKQAKSSWASKQLLKESSTAEPTCRQAKSSRAGEQLLHQSPPLTCKQAESSRAAKQLLKSSSTAERTCKQAKSSRAEQQQP